MNWLRYQALVPLSLLLLGSFSQQTQNAPKTARPMFPISNCGVLASPSVRVQPTRVHAAQRTSHACGCDAADFVNIRQGHYGKVKMDGFAVVT